MFEQEAMFVTNRQTHGHTYRQTESTKKNNRLLARRRDQQRHTRRDIFITGNNSPQHLHVLMTKLNLHMPNILLKQLCILKVFL